MISKVKQFQSQSFQNIEKNMSKIVNKLVDQLVDAVTASGKSFKDIEKNSIYAFLERQKVPRNTWDAIYSRLESVFSEKKGKTRENLDLHQGSTSMHDYSDSSHNDVKVRTPRKTVFSEIKKIAG